MGAKHMGAKLMGAKHMGAKHMGAKHMGAKQDWKASPDLLGDTLDQLLARTIK